MRDGVRCVAWADFDRDVLSRTGRVDSEWADEARLIGFMFRGVRCPAQLRMWHEHTRPQLAALLAEALHGIDGVVQLVLAWSEPTAEEASMAWEPELEEASSSTGYDVRCSRLGGVPYLQHDEEWPTVHQRPPDAAGGGGGRDGTEEEVVQADETETDGQVGAVEQREGASHSGCGISAVSDESADTGGEERERHSFVMQLRLSDLPAAIARAYSLPDRALDSQLIQAFGGGSSVYHGRTFCRLVDCSAPAKSKVVPPPGTEVYDTTLIRGWHEPHRVYPSKQQLSPDELFVPLDAPFGTFEHRQYALFDREGKYGPDWSAVQLSGWPYDDGRTAPSWWCDVCDERMELVMQINSAVIGFDVYGCSAPLAVSQCVKHKERIKRYCTAE